MTTLETSPSALDLRPLAAGCSTGWRVCSMLAIWGVPPAVLAADVAHDVLDAGVVLEPVDREVLAVPRLLEAAVRHLRDQRDVGVDPYRAEVQPGGHPHRPPVVTGPDARC